jgi:hypothetical protein
MQLPGSLQAAIVDSGQDRPLASEFIPNHARELKQDTSTNAAATVQ